MATFAAANTMPYGISDAAVTTATLQLLKASVMCRPTCTRGVPVLLLRSHYYC
jgi:hypothetical protein